MLKRLLLASLLVVLVAGGIQVMPAPAQESADPWPTDGWITSTPEEQGMDSDRLADLLAEVAEQDIDLHSIVVIRNGSLVTEVYWPGYTANTPHVIYSCTKSVISALVGIAIEQGYLEGVDQPILGFFPDRDFDNQDAAKEAMTIDDFLTMSSGLEWEDTNGVLTLGLATSRDPVQYVLDKPMAAEPGTEFVYNNGVPHVLSAIIQQETGMLTADFAQDTLFGPLGIRSEDYRWEQDWQGVSMGGWGLWMTPRDMAKLGYLYLHEGEWDGVQVVPAEWVTDSTRQHIAPGGDVLTYGYLWWIQPGMGGFSARGLYSQVIFVLPDQELVVVFTADLDDEDSFVPDLLMAKYILPAVQSSTPLPANPDGLARLEAAAALLAGVSG